MSVNFDGVWAETLRAAPWLAVVVVAAGVFCMLWVKVIGPEREKAREERREEHNRRQEEMAGQRAIAATQAQSAHTAKSMAEVMERMQEGQKEVMQLADRMLDKLINMHPSEEPRRSRRPRGDEE